MKQGYIELSVMPEGICTGSVGAEETFKELTGPTLVETYPMAVEWLTARGVTPPPLEELDVEVEQDGSCYLMWETSDHCWLEIRKEV